MPAEEVKSNRLSRGSNFELHAKRRRSRTSKHAGQERLVQAGANGSGANHYRHVSLPDLRCQGDIRFRGPSVAASVKIARER